MAAKTPGWAASLGKIIEAFDRETRSAAIRAHAAAVRDMAKIKGLTIGDIDIPRDALLPRDILEPDTVVLETEVFLRENGVSLCKGLLNCGTPATLKIEWKARPAPEATALVRTKAEAHIAKLVDGWTVLTPAVSIKEPDNG